MCKPCSGRLRALIKIGLLSKLAACARCLSLLVADSSRVCGLQEEIETTCFALQERVERLDAEVIKKKGELLVLPIYSQVSPPAPPAGHAGPGLLLTAAATAGRWWSSNKLFKALSRGWKSILPFEKPLQHVPQVTSAAIGFSNFSAPIPRVIEALPGLTHGSAGGVWYGLHLFLRVLLF
jgi:hypothetical protein